MTELPFDLRAWLDHIANEPSPPRYPPLVSRTVADHCSAVGMVEGQDFIVYPEIAYDGGSR